MSAFPLLWMGKARHEQKRPANEPAKAEQDTGIPGLTEEQVLGELLGWNETNAVPNWAEWELRYKARDTVRRLTGG